VISSVIVQALEAMKLEYPAGDKTVDWTNLKVV
jgi:hypothetical protein